MVKIFGYRITKAKASPKSGTSLSDYDREKAKEIRDLNYQIKALEKKRELEEKKAELMQLKDELYEFVEEEAPEESSPESMLMMLLMNHMFKGQMPNPMQTPDPQGVPVQQVEKITFSDDEIRDILKSFNKTYIKIAKKMDDVSLKKAILGHQQNVAPESVDRAVQILRNEF